MRILFVFLTSSSSNLLYLLGPSGSSTFGAIPKSTSMFSWYFLLESYFGSNFWAETEGSPVIVGVHALIAVRPVAIKDILLGHLHLIYME